MAEILVAVGGVVSVAQLVVYIVKTAKAVTNFCTTIEEVPVQIQRIKLKLDTLENLIEESKAYLEILDDDLVLPPDLRQALFGTVKRTQEVVTGIQRRLSTAPKSSTGGTRRKIKWVATEKRHIDLELEELCRHENTLESFIQVIILRGSILNCTYSKKLNTSFEKLNHEIKNLCAGGFSIGTARRSGHPDPGALHQRQSSLVRWMQAVISLDSCLWRLGFYGSLTLATRRDDTNQMQLHLGFRIPSWLSSSSVDIHAKLSGLTHQETGIRLTHGEIKLQNRVHDSSSFMMACRNGDIKLIRQHLHEKTASVSDKAICTGSTPLLLAIKGEHIQAMKCLLENGADPNVSDDNQTLPLFAVLGMNPQASKWVTQVPPSWSDWLTAFGLLIKHGASVHEINSDRSLIHLNISHGSPGLDLPYPEPSALDFFRILHNECFMDFNLPGPTLWNPIVTAVRRRSQSRKALEFLSNVGVDLSRIASDGDTSLHWAAEMAWSAESIEYLCSIKAVENISRQDAWGWTPLHYVVASTQYGCQEAAMDKAKCLLRHGADQDMKARKHPIFFVRKDLPDQFTPLDLSLNVDSPLSTLLMSTYGQTTGRVDDMCSNDVFFDAVEQQ